MKYYFSIFIITLSAILLLGGLDHQPVGTSSTAFAQPQPPGKPWTGKTADGKIITKEDLAHILSNHKKWLETQGKKGERVILSRAH